VHLGVITPRSSFISTFSLLLFNAVNFSIRYNSTVISVLYTTCNPRQTTVQSVRLGKCLTNLWFGGVHTKFNLLLQVRLENHLNFIQG
jgi:hypothetical protein